MKKQRTKLAVALLALACTGACVGAGVAYAAPTPPSGIVAQAETTYTVNSLTYTNGSASLIEAYPNDASGKPEVGSWDHVYTLQEGTGTGMCLNGTPLNSATMKFPNDFYIELKTSAAEGDVFTVDGTYYNEEKDTYFVFKNCALQYKGGAWVAYVEEQPEEPEVEYTTHQIGALELHVNSSVGGASGKNDALYLQRADGGELPILTWDVAFATTDGFKVNGEVAAVEMKSTGDGMYFGFSALKAGDVITVSGEYVCEEKTTKYVIEESKFTWNGSGWAKYIEVEYTTYEITNLSVHENSKVGGPWLSNGVLSVSMEGGAAVPDNWPWFNYVSGAGFKVNGEAANLTGGVPNAIQDMSGGLYFQFAGVNSGDVVSIGGVFANAELGLKYIIPETEFVWDGTEWMNKNEESEEPDVPEITYKEYNVSELVVHLHSTAGNANANNTTLWLYGTGDESNAWAYYTCESGVGVLLNGEALSCNVQDFGGGLYIKDFSVSAGDVITIGGTFVSEERATKYIIPESKFTWDGAGWAAYVEEQPEEPDVPVEYTTYELGALNFKATGNENKFTYLMRADGLTITAPNDGNGGWDATFAWKDGVGITLNGNAVTPTVKFPGDVFLEFGSAPNVDDVLTIGGTFYNENLKVKYVITESTFTWNGSAWVGEEPDVEYTIYELGALTIASSSADGGPGTRSDHLYTVRADGKELPYPDGTWSTVFVLESGDGLKINGESAAIVEIKSTDIGLWFYLSGVKLGDVISISGTFACTAKGAKYVIEESKFVWTGTVWADYDENQLPEIPDELVINISKLSLSNANASTLYAVPLVGDKLTVNSWAYAFSFVEGTGKGFQVNGEALTGWELKQPDTNLYIALGYEAQEGDVLVLDGEFYSEGAKARIVFSDCKLMWNGSAWESYVEYKEPYNAGTMLVLAEDPNTTAKGVSLYASSAEKLPVDSWDYVFVWDGTGVGITLDGQQIAIDNPDIKSPGGDLYITFKGLEAVENSVLVIGGTFKCEATGDVYVIEESAFIYDGASWRNKIDDDRKAACDALDEYKANFVQDNYYEDEWAAIQACVTETEAAINEATSSAAVTAALEEGKAAMDAILTKAEADEQIDALKANAKEELASYKNEADYREAEWAAIQEIIAKANTAIDESGSVTLVLEAKKNAKAEMDALKTNAQWEADEAVVAEAKEELAGYKAEADYHEAEWAAIQDIIAKANAEIDAEIGDSEAIAEIVEEAKAAMDDVLTSEEFDAALIVANEAKATLAGYKAEADYHETEWAAIQEIIAQANADIEENFGDSEAIAAIVEEAKADMDKVKTADVVDAEALAAAKEAALDEVKAYYAMLITQYEYSDEASGILVDYVASAKSAIESAATAEETQAAVTQFKANADAVEGTLIGGDSAQESTSSGKKKSGCGSFVGLSAGVAMAAAAAAVLFKKKED